MNINELDITRVTHTHTDCLDVIQLYENGMSKFFPFDWKHMYLSNKEFDSKLSSPFFIYEEKDPYPLRWLKALESIKNKYVFLDHEDMFLYKEFEKTSLEEPIKNFIEKDGDYLRLIKSDQCNYDLVPNSNSLYSLKKSSKWIFSIQPSIWKTSSLVKVLQQNSNVNVWDLEVRSQKVMKKLDIDSFFVHRNGKKRGMHHFDNDLYPYIATAILKGKWTISEYGEELFPLFIEFGINPSQRGWV